LSSTFSDLGVPHEIIRSLRARGITSAFPIQSMAIPPGLLGKDICGKAPTGSGKTVAFGIPVAVRVGKSRPGKPSALILAPTRELAGQIEVELGILMGPERKRRVASFYGGVGFGNQIKALRRGIDVAVACPGRLKDLVNRRLLSLEDVSIVVIDEADRMADMGFLPEVKKILDQVRSDRQTMLFSATLDGDVDQLVQRYQSNPVRVVVESEEQQPSIAHHSMEARKDQRILMTASLIKQYGQTIVFCRTKHGTNRVAKQLSEAGVKAAPIHGDRTQAQRERALETFAAGRVQALVATDVAARGIHVDDVQCVLHYDLPGDPKDYLHRSGRTGRAGSEGLVISFVTHSDRGAIRSIERAIGQQIIPLKPVFYDGNADEQSAPLAAKPRPRKKAPAAIAERRSSHSHHAKPSNSRKGRPAARKKGRPSSYGGPKGNASDRSRPRRRGSAD
jgi:superfamily II DNA/RNA helicase